MKKVLVLYYSRTGNTEKMANAVAEGAQSTGNVEVELNFHVDSQSLGSYDAIFVGAPTYHHDMPVDFKNLFEEAAVQGVNLKGKIGATFGSYGWSGEAPKLILEIMKYKFEMQVIEPPLACKVCTRPKHARSVPGTWKTGFRKLDESGLTLSVRRKKFMEKNKDLLDFLKNQVTVENEIVASLEKALVGMKNPAVKGVLKGVSLDSLKHAELYTSAITLLTNASTALTQDNLDEQRALVKKHIEIEAKLIQKLQAMIPSIENEKVVFLLKAILNDEIRHHAMLKMTLEIIVHGETITEADWWKMLWENVPFHGAPGGG